MAFKNDGDSYSRVFILGARDLNEDTLREEFEKYGTVKDVYFVKDRHTNERKDVAYVTMSKASEAALAIEQVNGKALDECARPLKVILANNRNEGSVREANEDSKMLRLFIVVPRGFSEKDIQDDFSKFGDIEYIRFVKDRKTGDSRGLAYVKFKRAYHAALALEGCDSHYKPVFASNNPVKTQPRDDDRRRDYDPFRRGSDRGDRYDRYSSFDSSTLPPPPRSAERDALDMLRNYPNPGSRILEAIMPTMVTYDQTVKLFDVVPGLEDFNYDQATGIVHAKYSMPQLATYARDKLDGFEYPPGYRLTVSFYKSSAGYEAFGSNSEVNNSISNSILAMNRGMVLTQQDPNGPGAIKSLVDTIQKAMLLLQQTGLPASATADMAWGLGGSSSSAGGRDSYVSPSAYGDNGQPRYCSVPLPDRQPFAPKDSDVAERLFIVSVPEAFPASFLEDCFCRFGNLINAYFMPGRNCGYVKYASIESARRAVNTLHMKTVCGNTLKVMVADEPPPLNKRRHDDDRRSDSPPGPKYSRMS